MSSRQIDRLKRIIALGAAVAGVAATVSLGSWQTRRGDEKLALQAQWDAAQHQAPSFVPPNAEALHALSEKTPKRVRLEGEFVPGANIFVDNRQLDGITGFFVVTPLRLARDLPLVLINRGFVPRNPAERTQLPPLPPPAGHQSIEGVAISRVPRLLELGSAPNRTVPGIWQNLDYMAFEQVTGQNVARFVVQQTSEAADGLKRDWPPPATGVEMHRGYAFQWYAMACLIAGLAIYFGLRTFKPNGKS